MSVVETLNWESVLLSHDYKHEIIMFVNIVVDSQFIDKLKTEFLDVFDDKFSINTMASFFLIINQLIKLINFSKCKHYVSRDEYVKFIVYKILFIMLKISSKNREFFDGSFTVLMTVLMTSAPRVNKVLSVC